jgi:hypothetical protein
MCGYTCVLLGASYVSMHLLNICGHAMLMNCLHNDEGEAMDWSLERNGCMKAPWRYSS